MTLLDVLILVVIVGVVLFLVERYIKPPPPIGRIVYAVVIGLLVLYLVLLVADVHLPVIHFARASL